MTFAQYATEARATLAAQEEEAITQVRKLFAEHRKRLEEALVQAEVDLAIQCARRNDGHQ